MKTVAVIPCFNEAKFIYNVVTEARKYVDEVIVVDNGSFDDTVLEAKKADVKVVYSHIKGMGASLRKGLKYEADIYVTLDGDGQHNPCEIPNLIKPILNNETDLTIGIRNNCDSMPFYRRLGNGVIAFAFNILSPIRLTDAQCGFRAFNRKVRDIRIKSDDFGCVTELFIKVRKLNYRIKPVSVSCVYHNNFYDNSSMNPIKHGVSVLLNTIRWRIWEGTGL